MTNLTEQWKKGELESGWYYTKLWKWCNVIDMFIGNQFLRYDDSDILEVIALVPSYEEWQSKENHEDFLQQRISVLESKNQQLKELLKECRKELKPLWDEWLYDYGDKTGNSSARFLRIDDLLNRIDQVTGEKK